jgi:hypothetical protein
VLELDHNYEPGPGIISPAMTRLSPNLRSIMDSVSNSSAGTKSGGGATACADVRVANAASTAEAQKEVVTTIMPDRSLENERAE